MRMMTHLVTGGIVMFLTAALWQIGAVPRSSGDLLARACLIAMNAGAATDVLLIVWRGRGIGGAGDIDEPPDGGPGEG